MASVINATAHGFVADDAIFFGNLVPSDCGIVEGQTYYVLATGLTADSFQFSETVGGPAFTFDFDITEGIASPIASYTESTDPAEPVPTTPSTPSAPTMTSALVSGIVRLFITVNDTAGETSREWEVQVTHKYDSNGDPDYTTPLVITMPAGSTEVSIPAQGETAYSARLREQDVFGNYSSFGDSTSHTTLAGNSALSAALADLANDVQDGIITATKIDDNAIETRHLSANSVTADALASTLILASLIYAGSPTSRHVEIDEFGIRLVDSTGEIIVNIPNDDSPVFFRGQVVAESFSSVSTNDISGTVSITGTAVVTLANGVSTPTVLPIVTQSVEFLTLDTNPGTLPIGLCYDPNHNTFFIGLDPTSGYIMAEYGAVLGNLIRRIPATGSVSTVTATLGSTSHVSDSAQSKVGSTDSHIATPLTLPSGLVNPQITKVAAYFAGVSGACTARVGIWTTGGVSLGESASFDATSRTFAAGNSDLYNKALSSPASVSAGDTVWAGFRRMNTSDTCQFDRDDGSGKTTKSADGTTANGTGWGTLSSSSKPNVWITYTHEVDTRLETNPVVGIAVVTIAAVDYIFALDSAGVIWRYDYLTGAYVEKSGVLSDISGLKSQAGLFYDATADELIVTTTTGTGAGVYPKFVRVGTSSFPTVIGTYSASAGTTFNGSSDTFRGGGRLADALNASAATYWIATTSKVYAYTFSGSAATQTSDRDFGQATTMGDGLTYDAFHGNFWGYDSASPTKVWKFTNWDFTTASTSLWIGYAWYDSAGTTHETAMSARAAAITIRRRERVQVQTPTIPVGGADDPDNVRIYALQNATDTGAGTFWLQVTDALTSRYLTSYTGSGTHDGAGTAFASASPAELRSAPATGSGGWSLKGSGAAVGPSGTAFPSSPATSQRFFRTDINDGMWFFYNGTRWLSETVLHKSMPAGSVSSFSATTANLAWSPAELLGGSDLWLESFHAMFFVNTGGTALGASHSWALSLDKGQEGNTTLTTIATCTLNSGANGNRKIEASIGALMNNGTTHAGFRMNLTKTGSPGAVFIGGELAYRIVAT